MVPQFDDSKPPIDSDVATTVSETQPLLWSVRRELWENRSIYLAPLAVAGFVAFASLISTAVTLPRTMRVIETLDANRQHLAVVKHFSFAPAPIMLATFLVGIFYSLDALYGERRDRSILFWKSLPVSDRDTVLSKASIPLVVLPAIGFTLSVAVFMLLLIGSTAVLMASGQSPARLWSELRFVQEPLIMLYGLIVHALWFAPVYCWFLLVSVWARRAPALWGVLPFVTVGVFERVAFGTSHFPAFLKNRFLGAMAVAFEPFGGSHVLDRLTQLTPGTFLATPALWVGLALSAAFLVGAMRLRRHREPI